MKKMNLIKKIVATGTVAALSVAMLAGTALAGAFVTNEKGIWYDNGDGTFPSSVWKWIDADGDGKYQCFAFDQNGYAYVNTTTPDGFTTDAVGAWVQNGVQAVRKYGENLADYAIVAKSGENVQSQAGNSSSASTTVSSSKGNVTVTDTTMKVGVLTSSNVKASDIVTKKHVVTTKASAGKGIDSTDSSEPDMSLTSYDTFGPSVPADAAVSNVAPLTDTTKLNVAGPDGKVSDGSEE